MGGYIRMNLREMGWKIVNWIYLTQQRGQWQALVNAVMNLRGFHKSAEILDWMSSYQFLMKDFAPWSEW